MPGSPHLSRCGSVPTHSGRRKLWFLPSPCLWNSEKKLPEGWLDPTTPHPALPVWQRCPSSTAVTFNPRGMLGSPDWALAWGGGVGGNQVGAPRGRVIRVYAGSLQTLQPPTLLSPQGNETCERLAVPGGSGSPPQRTEVCFPEGGEVGSRLERAVWSGLTTAPVSCLQNSSESELHWASDSSSVVLSRGSYSCTLGTAWQESPYSQPPPHQCRGDGLHGDQWLCLATSELTSR